MALLLATVERAILGIRQMSLKQVDPRVLGLAVLTIMTLFAPLELGQLAFAIVGASCFTVLQATRAATKRALKEATGKRFSKVDSNVDRKSRATKDLPRQKPKAAPHRTSALKQQEKLYGKQEYRQTSLHPVQSPQFGTDDFDAQVQELLARIAPSREGDALVRQLAAMAQNTLAELIPEAEVSGFSCGDVLRGTAFAVAIPEVDIILSASPGVIATRLRTRAARPLAHAGDLDFWKLQKSMVRACADELTSKSCFKFRRSAFKGQEPKVTLMAAIEGKSIPIDFYVNTATPMYLAALLTECGQIDPRAKELVLLVRRWAKDRGVSHAAKGHLSPYAWSLLAIYFLQVWDVGGGHVLPELSAFKMSSGLLRQQRQEAVVQQDQASHGHRRAAPDVTVASLYKGFVKFYTEVFDWRREAVSVRVGKRRQTPTSLPLHIVSFLGGATDVAPSVEDPFEPKRNLSSAMNGMSFGRLREEFARAMEVVSREAPSLSELLEPWVPPEADAVDGGAGSVGPPVED